MKLYYPNLNNKKNKKYRKKIKHVNFSISINANRIYHLYNNNCHHISNIDDVTKDIYCAKCNRILLQCDLVEKYNKEEEKIKQAHIFIWKRDHDRNRFTKYILGYLNGYYYQDIIEQCWLSIFKELPDIFIWYDVYKIFQLYRLGDQWLSFGYYIGYKCKLNSKIIYYSNLYTNEKIDQYRISYLYLLYKFTQLFGENEHDCRFIPLKGKLKWIVKMDHWWKSFCLKHWFEFKPTRIYNFKWNKKYRIIEFEKYLNNKIKLTTSIF
jgi:hypothetical protein